MIDTVSSPATRLRLGTSLAASIVTHAAVLAGLLLAPSFQRPGMQPPPPERPDGPTLDFIRAVVHGEKPIERPAGDSFGAAPPVLIEPHADESDGLQIGFDSDSSGQQLLAVIRSLRALVGFAAPEQARQCDAKRPTMPTECFYEHRFTAPDWTHEVGRFSLVGHFSLRVDSVPPELQRIRSLNGIPREYVAYALLPEQTLFDVEDAILEELKESGQENVVAATRVLLTFMTSSPRGFELRIVATKPVKHDTAPLSRPLSPN